MIAENIQYIKDRIERASARSGRNSAEITVVAVAKTFSSDAVREAVGAGVPDIGENYVQELLTKRSVLENEPIRWHFIGHLQTNKVKAVAGWIHAIHAVDSLRLGEEIAKRAKEFDRSIDILVEVNTSGETSKFGVRPDEAEKLVAALNVLDHIRVKGLMTIGPLLPDPESARPAFRMLRQLKESLEGKGILLDHLSMGMTNDFEVAIEEGATMIRVGTAIFGKRIKPE